MADTLRLRNDCRCVRKLICRSRITDFPRSLTHAHLWFRWSSVSRTRKNLRNVYLALKGEGNDDLHEKGMSETMWQMRKGMQRRLHIPGFLAAANTHSCMYMYMRLYRTTAWSSVSIATSMLVYLRSSSLSSQFRGNCLCT